MMETSPRSRLESLLAGVQQLKTRMGATREAFTATDGAATQADTFISEASTAMDPALEDEKKKGKLNVGKTGLAAKAKQNAAKGSLSDSLSKRQGWVNTGQVVARAMQNEEQRMLDFTVEFAQYPQATHLVKQALAQVRDGRAGHLYAIEQQLAHASWRAGEARSKLQSSEQWIERLSKDSVFADGSGDAKRAKGALGATGAKIDEYKHHLAQADKFEGLVQDNLVKAERKLNAALALFPPEPPPMVVQEDLFAQPQFLVEQAAAPPPPPAVPAPPENAGDQLWLGEELDELKPGGQPLSDETVRLMKKLPSRVWKELGTLRRL